MGGMKTDAALRILSGHQDRILAHLASDRALLAAEGEAARPALATRRWMLARLLREYQLFKHVEIFDPALAQGDRLGVAARLKGRCTAIGESFAAYIACWSSAAIDGRWSDYAAATQRMFDALARHVVEERRAIDTLLAGVERIERPGPRCAPGASLTRVPPTSSSFPRLAPIRAPG